MIIKETFAKSKRDALLALMQFLADKQTQFSVIPFKGGWQISYIAGE